MLSDVTGDKLEFFSNNQPCKCYFLIANCSIGYLSVYQYGEDVQPCLL
jgi:hypothetical protein